MDIVIGIWSNAQGHIVHQRHGIISHGHNYYYDYDQINRRRQLDRTAADANTALLPMRRRDGHQRKAVTLHLSPSFNHLQHLLLLLVIYH